MLIDLNLLAYERNNNFVIKGKMKERKILKKRKYGFN